MNTQFSLLTGMASINAQDVNCIKKVEKNDSVFYYLYTNKNSTLSVQDKIVDIINSNPTEGVTDVNNYLNTDCVVKNAEIVVEIKSNKLSSININTQLRFNLIGGDYMEENITLTNSVDLMVNTDYNNALNYTAPNAVESTPLRFGLNNIKYYILPTAAQ